MSYLDKNGLQRYHNGIKTELDNKADIDGTYEELTAGYANNLKFTGYREDNTPYILRQSGGDVDPGYKSEKTIVGASIVMNQLVHNGDFGRTTWWGSENGDISVADNVLTYVCTASGSMMQNGIFADIDAEIDHVYFVTADIKTEKANSGQWFFLTGSAVVSEANTWTTVSELKKATVTDTYFGIGLRVTTDIGETFQVRNAFIIDITKMFGTKIANYVYGLETATSGSGIAWLKQYFPAQFNSGYQAYSDGEIKSVSGLISHNTVGFNQWDEVWEVGVYNNSGESVTNSFQIRSKNYIPVFSSTTYYLAASAGNRICFYDANKTFISVVFDKQNTTFVTPVNCKYIRFNMADAYGTTYNHDICINISKPTGTPKNGDYVPYDGHTYAFDSTKTLRGLYKLDSDNKLYADGDVYKADGTIQRRYGVVDLGTLTWTMFATAGWFWADVTDSKNKQNHVKANAICSRYIILPVISTGSDPNVDNTDKSLAVGFNNRSRLYLHDSAYTDAATFKTAMSGVQLVYELATPTTETASPFSSSQRVNPDGTEEFIFDSTTEVKLPVGHVTKYMDQAALLDEIITPPEEAGTYALRKTVSDGVTTYTWEDDVIPSISVSKADGVSTITVTDETGTNSVEIADGETPHLVILSYGTSTWTDFINAYTTNSIVYCRASSNSNPASGSKTRMAFMAYVNNETNPTNVEFQYYRSVNQHSATQQGDQVYVYKLDKTAGWTVTVRESYTRVVAGTKMSSTWSNGILTMNFNGHDLPSGGSTGQVLKKTSGTDYDVGWSDASGGDVVVVNISSSQGSYIADKTFNEIASAINSGKSVVCRFYAQSDGSNKSIFLPYSISAYVIKFIQIPSVENDYISETIITINSSNVVSKTSKQHSTPVMPTEYSIIIDVYYDTDNSEYAVYNMSGDPITIDDFLISNNVAIPIVRLLKSDDSDGMYMNGGEYLYCTLAQYDQNYQYNCWGDPSDPRTGGIVLIFKNIDRTKTVTIKLGHDYGSLDASSAEFADIYVTT